MKRKLSALGKRLLSFLLVVSLVCSMGIPASAAGHREDTVSLLVGESIRLSASGWNTGWSSSDEAVATVSQNGTVTGVSAGTATITATTRGFWHGSRTIRYTVVVTAPEEVTITAKIRNNGGFWNHGKNGDFSSGSENWATFGVTSPAEGTLTVENGKAVAAIVNPGDADWNVQMIHYGIQLDQGATYELTFTGTSTADREIAVNLMSNTYAWYGGFTANLTAEEQTFTLTFTMEAETNNDAGLFISMGKMAEGDTPASSITLDNFSLKKVG